MMRALAIGAILAAALGVPAVGSAWGQAELPAYEKGKPTTTEPAWIVGPPGTMTLDGTDIRIVYRSETRDYQLFDGPVVTEKPTTVLAYLKMYGQMIDTQRREIGLLPK